MSLGNWSAGPSDENELFTLASLDNPSGLTQEWSNTGTSVSGRLAELDIEVVWDLPHQNDGIPFPVSLKGI